MKCPRCGTTITADMQEMGLCYECGFILLEIKDEETRKQEEAKRKATEEKIRAYVQATEEAAKKAAEKAAEEAAAKRRELWRISQPNAGGRYYEYRTVVVKDTRDGNTPAEQIERVLNEMGYDGWRLVTALTNELGKDAYALRIGAYTAASNATIDEVVLIFERVASV